MISNKYVWQDIQKDSSQKFIFSNLDPSLFSVNPEPGPKQQQTMKKSRNSELPKKMAPELVWNCISE